MSDDLHMVLICIILILMIEKRYTVHILIDKTILHNVDNKLIKANSDLYKSD